MELPVLKLPSSHSYRNHHLTKLHLAPLFLLFFFNATATTEIYTLSLHDALPISSAEGGTVAVHCKNFKFFDFHLQDRKSTRLNSSHLGISYAVFCLKKKTTELVYCRMGLAYSRVFGAIESLPSYACGRLRFPVPT